jgi:hypothetical protein
LAVNWVGRPIDPGRARDKTAGAVLECAAGPQGLATWRWPIFARRGAPQNRAGGRPKNAPTFSAFRPSWPSGSFAQQNPTSRVPFVAHGCANAASAGALTSGLLVTFLWARKEKGLGFEYKKYLDTGNEDTRTTNLSAQQDQRFCCLCWPNKQLSG